jgi:heme/copper-type cytochrome/quinol oxidase subunit 1
MPRRIPDYADGYAGTNELITLGSFLTFFSVLVFFYIVFKVVHQAQPTEGRVTFSRV